MGNQENEAQAGSVDWLRFGTGARTVSVSNSAWKSDGDAH
jgi:hypothetical protein